MNDVKKVAVLFGGWSPEREVSINSGRCVASVLREMGYDVSEMDVKKDLAYITKALYDAKPDFIFNVLHGTGGEDGVIQGVLDIFGVPYSNSGVLGSAICFDKCICKSVVASRGVRVVRGAEITAKQIASINTASGVRMEYPFILKPAANGSSVGTFLVSSENDLRTLQTREWMFGEKVMLEEYIKGREFTVLVIDGKALGAIEISFKSNLFDFKAKYSEGGARHIFDYELEAQANDEMLHMAELAFKSCGCRGSARVDFRYDGEQMYFLEINTQPGMTAVSLVPDIAKCKGISFAELLEMVMAGKK